MRRLNDHLFKALAHQAFHRFRNRIDRDMIALSQLFDDHAAREGAAHLIAREASPQRIFDCANRFFSRLAVACTKAHRQNGSFQDNSPFLFLSALPYAQEHHTAL